MNIFLKLSVIILIIFLNSCSKKEEKISMIHEKELRLQMIDAYKEGVKALEEGDVLFAAKKFNEAENIISPISVGFKICINGSIFILCPRLLLRCNF